MKVIFLDVDGVLNCQLFYTERHKRDLWTFRYWFNSLRSRIKWVLNGFKYKAVSLLNYVPKKYTLKEKIAHFKRETDQKRLSWLNELCKETGAVIVVSSVWKTYFKVDEWNECFKTLNCPDIKVIGITIDTRKGFRGEEIQYWLDRNPVDNYAIIDDDSDMLDTQMKHFFWTDNYSGLTPTTCYKIKRFFKNG